MVYCHTKLAQNTETLPATFDRRIIIAIWKKYVDIFQQTRKTSTIIILLIGKKITKLKEHIRNTYATTRTRTTTPENKQKRKSPIPHKLTYV